jgi:hypothetical protein
MLRQICVDSCGSVDRLEHELITESLCGALRTVEKQLSCYRPNTKNSPDAERDDIREMEARITLDSITWSPVYQGWPYKRHSSFKAPRWMFRTRLEHPTRSLEASSRVRVLLYIFCILLISFFLLLFFDFVK